MQLDGAKARVGTWSCRSKQEQVVTCPPMNDAPAIVAEHARQVPFGEGCGFLEEIGQGIRNSNASLSLGIRYLVVSSVGPWADSLLVVQ